MIVSLRGKLIEAGVLRVVIESSGVGYEVNVPVTTAERLPKLPWMPLPFPRGLRLTWRGHW